MRGRKMERQCEHYVISRLSVLEDCVTYGPMDNLHGLFLFYCIQFPWFLQMIKQAALDNSYEHLRYKFTHLSPNHMYSSSAVILLNVHESLEKYQKFGRPGITSVYLLRFDSNTLPYFVVQILWLVLIWCFLIEPSSAQIELYILLNVSQIAWNIVSPFSSDFIEFLIKFLNY